MIVTANLAKGAVNEQAQGDHQTSQPIQNIGAMDTLCTDKTGTLDHRQSGAGTASQHTGESDEEVLKWTYLNSYHQTGLKSLLDLAILEHVELHDTLNADEAYKKVDEIPLISSAPPHVDRAPESRRQPSADLQGAVEEMLRLCSRAYDPGDDRQLQIDTDQMVAMDDHIREHILNMSRQLNQEAAARAHRGGEDVRQPQAHYTCDDGRI